MRHKDNKDREDENPIRKNLEEQFGQLGSNVTPPEDLEKEVFDTIDTLALFGDVLDLFTAKFTQSEAHLIDLISDPEDSQQSIDEDSENDLSDESTAPEA